MDQKHVKLSIIGFAILLVGLVGVSFAFFNYTRTGTANIIRTGNIYFNAEQGLALNMTNVFPMTSSEASNANLNSVTVGIEGDTTYADGEEFEITLVDVTNTVNGKSIPMNFIATYTATTGNSIGTSSDTYWESRESKNADIYTLNATGKVEEGKQVLVGYIKNSATGINGTLTIKAYIDADRIAITDTPDENTEWQQGRTVFTTTEWNSFQSSGSEISFKIKAESNEGIWVEEPSIGTIDSCSGCKFMYIVNTPMFTTWNNLSETTTVLTSGLYENYQELIAITNKNYFLGVKLNSNNEVTNAYACGVKDDVPFCIEGTSDGLKYATNQTLLQGADLYNNTCTVEGNPEYTQCETFDNSGSFSAIATSDGSVSAGAGVGISDNCVVLSDGAFGCDESGSGGPGSGDPTEAPTMNEMCPNCVFIYTTTSLWTTWNTNSQTPTVLTSSDYEEDYEDVITSSGKNFFLGLKLNGSNQIEKAYACGLYNGTTPFCIEGYYDNSKYEANQEILQNEYLWNNTCSEYLDANTGYGYDYTECLAPSAGLVDARANSYGYVFAGVNEGDDCGVFSNGEVFCRDGK